MISQLQTKLPLLTYKDIQISEWHTNCKYFQEYTDWSVETNTSFAFSF